MLLVEFHALSTSSPSPLGSLNAWPLCRTEELWPTYSIPKFGNIPQKSSYHFSSFLWMIFSKSNLNQKTQKETSSFQIEFDPMKSPVNTLTPQDPFSKFSSHLSVIQQMTSHRVDPREICCTWGSQKTTQFFEEMS